MFYIIFCLFVSSTNLISFIFLLKFFLIFASPSFKSIFFLAFYSSFLAFYSSFLVFYSSFLAFHSSFLAFYSSFLAFYSSFLTIFNPFIPFLILSFLLRSTCYIPDSCIFFFFLVISHHSFNYPLRRIFYLSLPFL